MITKLARDIVQDNAANAALVGGSGLALAGSTNIGNEAVRGARDVYLRVMNPATNRGRWASILGGYTTGKAGELAWHKAMQKTIIPYANAEGTLSDGIIRQLADAIGAPKDTEINRVSSAKGNFSSMAHPWIQHTGTSAAAHELGHVTSPFARTLGRIPMSMAYAVGRDNIMDSLHFSSMLEASRDYDARHGLKSSKTTKAIKTLNSLAALLTIPTLAEEAQATIRGYGPVKQVLGNAEARRYLGRTGLSYLTYLGPLLMAMTAGKQLGRSGGRLASRLVGDK